MDGLFVVLQSHKWLNRKRKGQPTIRITARAQEVVAIARYQTDSLIEVKFPVS